MCFMKWGSLAGGCFLREQKAILRKKFGESVQKSDFLHTYKL